MNTKILVLVVVLVVILGALLWLVPVTPKTSIQTPAAAPVEDTTAAINKDLDSIQLDDTSKDFMNVDKDLKSL